MDYLKFIDLSHYNNERGPIDWAKLTDWDGFMVKLTEGTTYIDPEGIGNVKHAQKLGKLVGGYHFARFNDVQTAGLEAKFFIQQANFLNLDFLALDIEHQEAKGDLTRPALVFLDTINLLGKTMIYSYPYFIKQHFNKQITKYPLWVAHYGVPSPEFLLWKDWVMWQYTDSNQIEGLTGNTDCNIMKIDFGTSLKTREENNISVSDAYISQYKVEKGDTLSSIAAMYDTTVSQLVNINRIADPNRIVVGEKLIIPQSGLQYPGYVIRQGSTDDQTIKYIQAKVGVQVDGIYGGETEKAIKTFQRTNHLSVDGVVGPSTWAKLFG